MNQCYCRSRTPILAPADPVGCSSRPTLDAALAHPVPGVRNSCIIPPSRSMVRASFTPHSTRIQVAPGVATRPGPPGSIGPLYESQAVLRGVVLHAAGDRGAELR